MLDRSAEFKSFVREELVTHLPYTLAGIAAAVAFVFLFMSNPAWPRVGEEQFHWAHVIHIFFSAAAGAALFRSYHDSLLKAVPVAVLSSVVLCTISDIVIPYAGLRLSGYDAHLHLCLLEHPARVILGAFLGVGAGLLGQRFFVHCNQSFHLLHLLISTAASTLYLMHMIHFFDLRIAVVIAATLFGALVLPCLAGDIVVPLLFVRMKGSYRHRHRHRHGAESS